MGHIASKNYHKLQNRLDMNAQGAPTSEALYKILEILFSEDEADKVSKLPIIPFVVAEASKRWGLADEASKKILDNLADKGLLLDMEHNGRQTYILAPTMAGFFEFSLMRTDGRFNQKLLSELFYQYINEENDFVEKALMQKTAIARTFIQERAIPAKDQAEILDYERATHIIDSASCITVGTCYCRHKMEHVGKACDMPQDVCLTLNSSAESLIKHKIAKQISKAEARKILDQCVNLGLVQIGDNVQNTVNWMCNCCGCCCEAIGAYKKLGHRMKINSNFYAKVKKDLCIGCGACQQKCPVDAIKIINNKAVVDKDICIGCGVCHRFCGPKAILMERRKKPLVTPADSFERCLLNAIEQGKLQNYIFDNYDLWTNELLRHLVGVLFKLSPAKFLLANDQIKSKFLIALRKAKKSKLFSELQKPKK
jgi:Pyruvate/2-oxoacid:ferredoxin oxidoreductase delta subunit